MNKVLKYSKGITLTALTVTIVLLLILSGISIGILSGNFNIVNKTDEAVVLTEIGQIKDFLSVTLNYEEKVSGKLSDLTSLDIPQNLITKYNDLLYIKDNEVYLSYIAGFPKSPKYISNKKILEILNDHLEICYDSLKSYNKLQNPYFDDGLNNCTLRSTTGNITEIRNENGNNYLHIEMHLSSGNTQWVRCGNTKVADDYEDLCYSFVRYRNSYVPAENNFVINNDIIVLSRYGRGFDTILLNKKTFINSYNSGWNYVSNIRKINSKTKNLGLQFSLGGGPANGQKQEYSVDFDDLYILNLTELFGAGGEPSQKEMDNIFTTKFS